jgi:hypothetical protein
MDTDPHGKMTKFRCAPLMLICVLSLLAAQPAAVQSYAWSESGLERVLFRDAGKVSSPAGNLDLNKDGLPERVQAQAGMVSVQQGDQIVWASPAGWRVLKAQAADLNNDGEAELALLVSRLSQELPINDYVAVPWEHPAYTDEEGFTYHLILIGGAHEGVGELWAGSGLVRPMADIFTADLDGDGRSELVGVERALPGDSGGCGAVSVWRWTGFTFSLLDRRFFHQMQQVNYVDTPDRGLLLISGREVPNDFKE